MINFLIDNWTLIVVIICFITITAFNIYSFWGLPTAKQHEKVVQWLLYAVVEAEKIFGGQTGVIKLRYVYDRFIEKFPAVARVITFETFSSWVDEALEQMRHLLETNKAIENYTKEVV